MKKPEISIVLIFTLLFSATCSSTREIVVETPQKIATAWAGLTLDITKNTPSNSPTFASRALGYIGVTMYESIVHGYPTHRSLVNQLNGLSDLPLPETGSDYDWMLSLNAAQASILKNIYIQTSDANKKKIDSLESYFYNNRLGIRKDDKVAERSVAYGRVIAEAIFEWSKTDGGHRGYLKNFDKAFQKQNFPGCWEPPLYGQSISHFPLHPHWGENRPFLKRNEELQVPLMIKYDKGKVSDYYKEFEKVYAKSKSLTQEEKEAALWWGDDPGETFTPPGHSYYLATLVIKKTQPELIKCAETYARVGIAVADAFINCWKWKYHFYSERPSSYISKNIDERWESFWPDPPFPAFPSGHATQAAAVATVLTDLYGEGVEITDDSHAGRQTDQLRNVGFKSRSFKTFWSVAEETANSRFYGGIHSPQDNAVGLTEGSKMGKNINDLVWSSNKSSYVQASQQD